jgi:chromosome segregation protein
MYLRKLEIVGFKSFADRTVLEFERGMTVIVGPNGCGKSNVSDAIRWVLGEQSAKALRGGKMEDCIFNGTDQRKGLGMAEVSLTLAECEQVLGTEYNEVTITRRVFRSGEGQYFINKTPCRLKDIQRLFMDTGVGTNSYSVLEQGRIDMILSARPEDRREVFEEASGITKYKADKREALRKLEQTEANLLRLADIIREVRRQIISLQRQAGKARRYQELHNQLRGYDLFFTRQRRAALDDQIRGCESRLASLAEQDEAVRADVQESEAETQAGRRALTDLEEQIARAVEQSIQARTELGRVHELIGINRDRIQELRLLSERDHRDAEEAARLVGEHRTSREEADRLYQRAVADLEECESSLHEVTAELNRRTTALSEAAAQLDQLRAESIDLESRMAHGQNQLADLDTQQRGTVIRRERLAAEQSEIRRTVELFQERRAGMQQQLDAARQDAQRHEAVLRTYQMDSTRRATERQDVQATLQDVRSRIAARRAQIELLSESHSQAEGFPGGARWLLDPAGDAAVDRTRLLGALADQILADPPYQTALEAALRAWLDAVIVADEAAAREILEALESSRRGAVRLLVLDRDSDPAPEAGDDAGVALLNYVQCSAAVRPLAERLLRNVRVVERLAEAPARPPLHRVYVTRGGAVLRGDGTAELWTRETQEDNPVTRRHTLALWNQELASLELALNQHDEADRRLKAAEGDLGRAIEETRRHCEASQRNLALLEGEFQIISQEAGQAEERLETVTWELNALNEQDQSGAALRQSLIGQLDQFRDRQAGVRHQLTLNTEAHRRLDQERVHWLSEATELRVKLAERRQEVEMLERRRQGIDTRITELEKLSSERRLGVHSYQARIESIEASIVESESRIAPLEQQAAALQAQVETARRQRETLGVRLAALEEKLGAKRQALDELRGRKSELEVSVAQERIRRQNLLERVLSDYRITAEQMAAEPAPEWPDGREPDRETIETTIAELRTKLDAMGPVNLAAIEENNELEERYRFLTQEQDDLQKSKAQLIEMIRKINKTTTEMFSKTFELVNANFQEMFKKLFGGGSAKLVLLNEEDVLESGIEIIARPPGKKLQTVSLLSGGERTMTAVALLFSLFLVKPSAFCMLDELDAALDDANIGRFVQMLEGFLQRSQFVVITHNRQTIAAADALYGVTMEDGVSRIISARFTPHHRAGPAPASPETPVAAE